MYVGHFAIGLAIKNCSPKTPALPIMIGVGLMDIVDGLLIIAGVNRVTPDLESGPYLYFDLTFIDWDHSVLMALVLATLWALIFKRDRRTAFVAFLAVISHFFADWPMHNNDLALYPYAQDHFGYGLWGRLGTGAWVLEGLFSLLLLTFAWWRSRIRGVSLFWPTVVLALLFVQLSPWLSPMYFVAQLSEPAAYLVHGLLILLGFLGPGLLLTWLVDRAERASTTHKHNRASESQMGSLGSK